MSLERWHGTAGGYTNHKCRCEACRRAQRDYMRRYRVSPRPERVCCSIAPELDGPGDAQTSPTLADTSGKVTT